MAARGPGEVAPRQGKRRGRLRCSRSPQPMCARRRAARQMRSSCPALLVPNAASGPPHGLWHCQDAPEWRLHPRSCRAPVAAQGGLPASARGPSPLRGHACGPRGAPRATSCGLPRQLPQPPRSPPWRHHQRLPPPRCRLAAAARRLRWAAAAPQGPAGLVRAPTSCRFGCWHPRWRVCCRGERPALRPPPLMLRALPVRGRCLRHRCGAALVWARRRT
jgi:hypothetical protein